MGARCCSRSEQSGRCDDAPRVRLTLSGDPIQGLPAGRSSLSPISAEAWGHIGDDCAGGRWDNLIRVANTVEAMSGFTGTGEDRYSGDRALMPLGIGSCAGHRGGETSGVPHARPRRDSPPAVLARNPQNRRLTPSALLGNLEIHSRRHSRPRGESAAPEGNLMKCEKCSRQLHDCQGCRGGRSNLTCNQCRTTGLVCSEHGGHWRR